MKKLFGTLVALSLMAECALSAVPVFAAAAEVQADADALTAEDILTVPVGSNGYLIDNLDLDRVTKGEINESPVVWSSSNESVISKDGIVTRPDTTTDVTLTATIGADADAVTKDFTFKVPAKNIAVNGMPVAVDGGMIYEDNFSDGTMDSKITFAKGADSDIIQEANGKLELYRSEWTSGEPYIDIAAPSSASTGNAVYEYTLDLGQSDPPCWYMRNQFIGTKWSGYPLYIEWGFGKQAVLRNGLSTDIIEGGKLKVMAYFDFTNKQFSLWLNNELAFENIAFIGGSDVMQFRISTVTGGDKDGLGRILIDNFKAYKAEKSVLFTDLEGIDKTMAANSTVANANGTVYLIDNLSFAKTAGASGSDITYSVNDSTAVNANGIITRDIVDRPVTVTVTAKDKIGGEFSKNYDYVVPGKYHIVNDENGLAIGERLSAGTVNWAGTDKMTAPYVDDGNILSFTSGIWGSETGFDYKYASPLTGKVIQKISFKSPGKGIRIRLYDRAYAVCDEIMQTQSLTVFGETYQVNGVNVDTRNQQVDIELLIDFGAKTITPYVNGTRMSDKALTIGNLGVIQVRALHQGSYWCVGTTEVSSLAAYSVADISGYPALMRGDAVFSNAAPAAGENKVTVPFIKTTDGEQACNILYAIYSADGTLLGVSVQPVTLSNASQQEYTLSLTLDSVSGGETQKVFFWDSSILPVTAEPFPA